MVGGLVKNDARLWLAIPTRVGMVPNSVPSGEIAMNGPEASTPNAVLYAVPLPKASAKASVPLINKVPARSRYFSLVELLCVLGETKSNLPFSVVIIS